MKIKHPSDRFALPVMQCDEGCGDCCGPVLCHDWEYQRVEAHIKKHNITPINQGLTCPLYQGGKCTVYESRPYVCRTYGHFASVNMTCPKGYNVNVSKSEQRRMDRLYFADTDAPFAVNHRWLHELLGPNWDEDLLRDYKEYIANADSALSASVAQQTVP